MASSRDFDALALYDALDRQRRSAGLSWTGLAQQMCDLSADLNASRGGHPVASSTLRGVGTRGSCTCQHAALMLRWLGRAPEEFIAEPHPATRGVPLPAADAAHRLRWNLVALYEALNADRLSRRATWEHTGQRLHCTASRLTGLRTAKYATEMKLAMRICQDLGRPAADFIRPATW